MKRQRMIDLEYAIMEHYGLNKDYLRSPTRKREITHARQVFFYIAYIAGFGSLGEIGRYTKRNHATVLYGRNKIIDLKLVYKDTRNEIDAIMRKMKLKELTDRDKIEEMLDALNKTQLMKARVFIYSLLENGYNRKQNAKVLKNGLSTGRTGV